MVHSICSKYCGLVPDAAALTPILQGLEQSYSDFEQTNKTFFHCKTCFTLTKSQSAQQLANVFI